MDDTTTSRPPASMWGTAALQVRNVPVSVEPTVSSQSARLSSRNGATRATPAAQTTTSMRPAIPPATSAATSIRRGHVGLDSDIRAATVVASPPPSGPLRPRPPVRPRSARLPRRGRRGGRTPRPPRRRCPGRRRSRPRPEPLRIIAPSMKPGSAAVFYVVAEDSPRMALVTITSSPAENAPHHRARECPRRRLRRRARSTCSTKSAISTVIRSWTCSAGRTSRRRGDLRQPDDAGPGGCRRHAPGRKRATGGARRGCRSRCRARRPSRRSRR